MGGKIKKAGQIFIFYLLGIEILLGASLLPQMFHIDLDRSVTQELMIRNGSNESLRYNIMIDEPGEEWDDNIIEKDWVRFYPKVVSIPPMSQGIVRFRVTPPKGIKDGEYSSYLMLEQIPDNSKLVIIDESEFNVGQLYHHRLAIYGQKGEADLSGEVSEMSVQKKEEGMQLSFLFSNFGNSSLKPSIKITYLDDRGREIEVVQDFFPAVLASNKKELQYRLKEDFEEVDTRASSVEVEIHHFDMESQKELFELHKERINI